MQEKDLSWARPDSIWQNPTILPSKDRAFMAGADVMFYAGKDPRSWNRACRVQLLAGDRKSGADA